MVQRRDIRFSNRILQAIALRLEPLKPGLPEYEKVLGEQKLGPQLGRWVHPGCQELRRVGWQKDTKGDLDCWPSWLLFFPQLDF